MKKYWHVIGIGIQNNLTYRVNYLTRTLFSFIPLFAMLSLWRTIYAGQGGAISGYTMAQMIFYYLLVAVVAVLTSKFKIQDSKRGTHTPPLRYRPLGDRG